MKKMNPEIKSKWIERLESGEIEQTTGSLCRTKPFNDSDGSSIPAGMCCLGVLSEIAVEEGIIHKVVNDGDSFAYYGDEGAVSYLPDSVVEWSGVEFNGRYKDQHGGVEYLSALNDEGASFAEIAEIIRQYL